MEGTMSIYPGMLLTYLSSSGVGFVMEHENTFFASPLFQPLTNSGWPPLGQGSDLPLAPGFYTFDASLSIR